MKYLSKEQEKKLDDAFSAICNLEMASEKDNHSLCSCFHIQPFHSHWDKQTVKEVMYQVKLYIGSWVISPMEDALLKGRNNIKKNRLKEHKLQKKQLKEFLKSKQ